MNKKRYYTECFCMRESVTQNILRLVENSNDILASKFLLNNL